MQGFSWRFMSSYYLLMPKDGLENTYFNWQARSVTFLYSRQTTGILIHLLAIDSTPWALAEFRVLVELQGLTDPVKPLSYTVCYLTWILTLSAYSPSLITRNPSPLYSSSPHHALTHCLRAVFATSSLLTQPQQLKTPSHPLFAFEIGYAPAALLKTSTPSEQDWGESEKAPGSQNGSPVIRMGSLSLE